MRYLIMVSILVMAFYTNGVKAQTKDTTSKNSAPATQAKKSPKLDRNSMHFSVNNPLFQNEPKSWAVGANIGLPFVEGAVPVQLGFGYDVFVRKAIGNSISLRLEVDNGYCRGLDWQAASAGDYGSNTALNGSINPNVNYAATKAPVYYNYKMDFTNATLQVLYNINNINLMKEHPWFGLYVYGGFGTMLFKTYTNQLNANGQMYDYAQIPVAKSYSDRKATLAALNKLLDNTYETAAETSDNTPALFGETALPLLTAGMGMDFKITERIGINVDAAYGYTGSRWLDGDGWYSTGIPATRPDAFLFLKAGVTFRLGSTDNAYWLSNPLYLPYKEIIDDRAKIQSVSDKVDKDLGEMKSRVDTISMREDSLMGDKDSDGVSDYFDMEENTPKGAIVDGAGRTIFYKDTAGNLVFNDPNMEGAINNKMNGEENDPEGTTYKTDPDGTTYKTYPDGTVFQTNPDGTRYRKNPDGTTYKTTPDGKHYKIKADGSQEDIAYDGTQPDAPDTGTLETAADGTKTRKMKNGLVYKTTPDGKHYKVKPDGTQEETTYDGTNPDNGANGALAGKNGKGKKYKFNPNNQSGKTTILKSDGKGGFMTPGSNSAIGYLPAIFFDTDASFVKHDYYPEMFVAATSIRQNPKIKVKIIGHCDYRNSEAYNMSLGLRRAQAVAKILTEYFGIPADQLIIESKGKTEPLTNAKSVDALQLNRRVQFELLDGKKAIKFTAAPPASDSAKMKGPKVVKHKKAVRASATFDKNNSGNMTTKPNKSVAAATQTMPDPIPVPAPSTAKDSIPAPAPAPVDTTIKLATPAPLPAPAPDTAAPKSIFISSHTANMSPKEAKKAEAKREEEEKRKAKEVKKAQERMAKAEKKKEKEEEKAAKKKAKEEAKEAKKHKKDNNNNGTDDVIQSGN